MMNLHNRLATGQDPYSTILRLGTPQIRLVSAQPVRFTIFYNSIHVETADASGTRPRKWDTPAPLVDDDVH
jgi:hypothetical protein